MNKIICDVCGTSYPETDTQCPICGCIRPGEVHTISGDTNEQVSVADNGSYTYVKGGRFSKSNVRKRIRSEQNNASEASAAANVSTESDSKKDKGLMIAVVALLLAIVAVVVYIVVHFFTPSNITKPDPMDQTTAAQTTVAEQVETTQLNIPCEELLLGAEQVQFEEVDASWLLKVQTLPENTTDVILFASSDPAVATVSADGLITAVSEGTAQILVSCGKIEITCEVVCSIPEETEPTEAETEPTTEPTTEPKVEFTLNRSDFSLFHVGETWNVYDGDLDPKEITWSSDDETVVTVTDGVVEAVGSGSTKIYAEYDGEKISCIVHCKFTNTTPTRPTVPAVGPCKISHNEVTLRLDVPGYTEFVLTLTDSQGNPVNVTWQSTNSCCSVTGNIIKGVTTGTTRIYTVYEGVQYYCDVYVYYY